jgi:GAF domain-containing protein
VLSVISRSPNDVQPVFDTIARIAQRLCQSEHAFVLQRGEGGYRLVVANDAARDWVSALKANPVLPDRGSLTGRVALERRTVHVDDLRADPEYTLGPPLQHGVRSELGVPLMRDGEVIGVIIVGRTEVYPFTNRQIALVETFADQAVIAIENTRLFEAEQASKRELQESLEYQTAISDVLNVISRSPNRLQPVFEVIAQNASRLCGGEYAIVTRYDGSLIQLAAQHNPRPGAAEETARLYPLPAEPKASATSRAIVTGSMVHVPDVEKEELIDSTLATFRRISARAILSVPMLHRGQAIGGISVSRATPGPFSNRQIGLLRTFADQAVITIENTRLFEAEQASKRELQESLEQQTATSEVLEVISSSPGELERVFQTMLENAVRICDAKFGALFRYDRAGFHRMAGVGTPPALVEFQRQRGSFLPGSGGVIARVWRTRQVAHSVDSAAEPNPGVATTLGGARSIVGVPMLKDNELVGAIAIYRQEVRAFTEKQIRLVTSFAAQAVIAIENTRLLNELRESLQQQTATADVLKVISRSALDVQKVLDALVESAARLCDAGDAVIFRVFGDGLRLIAHYGRIPTPGPVGQFTVPLERGSIGPRAIIDRGPIHVADILADGDEYPESQKRALRVGYRTTLAVPLIHAGEAIGVIMIRRAEVRPFTERQIELVNTFADQAVIAIENSRLFEEVQARTRELAKTVEDLEIASQHKNQFVANMSHELRTPLAAILGYAELIQEGFYGALPEKSLNALTRIRSNGKHLLGLINTVLDIAKIESGQFTLDMSEYAMESVVETVRAATESLAQNKKLTLTTSVDSGSRLASATNSASRRCCSISLAMPSSSRTPARCASPPVR